MSGHRIRDLGDTSWRDQGAACAGRDDIDWFPIAEVRRFDAVYRRKVRDAKAVCASCPVRQQCLDEALGLAPGDDFGIWGGTTEAERRELRLRRRVG